MGREMEKKRKRIKPVEMSMRIEPAIFHKETIDKVISFFKSIGYGEVKYCANFYENIMMFNVRKKKKRGK